MRQRHRGRTALAGAAAAALAVAALIVVPRLVSTGTGKHGSSGPTPTTSVTTSVTPTAQPSSSLPFLGDYYVYRDDAQGWQLDVPPDWRSSIFEGTTEFVPPRATFPEVGKPTFWIAVSIRAGAPAGPDKGAPVTPETGLEARSAGPAITGSPGGGQSRLYQYDWTGLCVATNECPSDAVTLQVVIQGTDPHWWESYGELAQTYLRTLAIAKDSTTIGDVHTRFGIVDASAAEGYDTLTSTLVRFLDARVEQGGAESLMSAQAKKDFTARSNCLFLYESNTAHAAWTGYEVISRFNNADRAQFNVMMKESPRVGGYVESLVIGTASGSSTPVMLRGLPSCSNN